MEHSIRRERAVQRVEVVIAIPRWLHVEQTSLALLCLSEVHHLVSPPLRCLGDLDELSAIDFPQVVLTILEVLDMVGLGSHLILALLSYVGVFECIRERLHVCNVIEEILVVLRPESVSPYQYF